VTVTLRIQAEHPGLRPVVSEQIIIEAVTGSAGASLEDRVLGGSFEPMIGATGVLEVDLEPVDVHGEPIVYRVTVGGEVRHLDLSEAAEDATVDWSDDAYLVVDTSELPPSWTPVVGPAGPAGAAGPQGDPGVVAATGLATYDDQTQTIDVTATAADVGADPAGSAAAVAGDLSTHEGLTTTAHGGVVASTDPRLTDARTPTAHAASHQDGGSDELALDGSQITTGTVAAARLGSGTASSGTYLRGDQTWQAVPSGGIPETLIDAAGDLIVGTAADTAGRLALGAAGTVLTSSGSAAEWQANRHGLTVPLPSAIGFHRRIGANVSMVRGTVWWIRIPEIAHDAKVTHVWIDTVTGVSSCTATGAIVSTTTAGKPGTVLASTAVGAIDMSVSAAMNGAALSSPYTLTTGGSYWVAVLALGGASDPAVRGADGVESWLNVNVGTAPVTPATNNTYGCLRLTGQASIPDTPAAIVGTVTPVVYLSVEAP
jgi:hypothetical protein